MPSEDPRVVNLEGVEIFRVGEFNHDRYSRADLEGMIRAAGEVGFEPPVKLGHMSDDDTDRLLKHEGMPSFGWVRNLRMRGDTLVADLCGIPRRVADLIRNGAYKRLSAEIFWNFASSGRSWPRVLKAVSLLGSEVPAVTDLRALESLYAIKPIEGQGELKVYQGDILVTAAPQMVLMQKEKDAVQYRLSENSTERCGTCSFFLGASTPGSVGACGLVEGEIASDALCDLHELRDAYDFEGAADGNGNGAVVKHAADRGAEPQAPTAGKTCAAATPKVAQERNEMSHPCDPQEIVCGGWVSDWCTQYTATHGGTFEEAFNAFRTLRPEDAATYLRQVIPDERGAIAGVPVKAYAIPGAVAGAVIVNFPGTDIRVEPRGGIGTLVWVVMRGEDEVGRYPTQAEALAAARALAQTGFRTHSLHTRRYQVEPTTAGVTLDEATRRDFDPSRLAAITRLTAKAALIQKRFHEARQSGAYGAHHALTGAKSLMTWQEAVAGACTSLSTDAAIAGPAGIAVVMRADPAAAG